MLNQIYVTIWCHQVTMNKSYAGVLPYKAEYFKKKLHSKYLWSCVSILIHFGNNSSTYQNTETRNNDKIKCFSKPMNTLCGSMAINIKVFAYSIKLDYLTQTKAILSITWQLFQTQSINHLIEAGKWWSKTGVSIFNGNIHIPPFQQNTFLIIKHMECEINCLKNLRKWFLLLI